MPCSARRTSSSWERVATASQILGGHGRWLGCGSIRYGLLASIRAAPVRGTDPGLRELQAQQPTVALGHQRRASFQLHRGPLRLADRRVRATARYYFDFALFDLVVGAFYANNLLLELRCFDLRLWLLPYPGGRWLHFTQQSAVTIKWSGRSASLYSYGSPPSWAAWYRRVRLRSAAYQQPDRLALPPAPTAAAGAATTSTCAPVMA